MPGAQGATTPSGRPDRQSVREASGNEMFIKRAAVHYAMSKGAEVARNLKMHLPQHADDLEAIAEDFDGLEEDFSECRKVLERLNTGPA